MIVQCKVIVVVVVAKLDTETATAASTTEIKINKQRFLKTTAKMMTTTFSILWQLHKLYIKLLTRNPKVEIKKNEDDEAKKIKDINK